MSAEPTYVAQFNADGAANLVLLCDHASNHIPAEFRALGLRAADLQRHIAWDIGALPVAQHIATALDAPLVYPTASRLVIDCNRDPAAADAIPETSEGTPIPGNVAISGEDRARRIAMVYEPFHMLAAETIARQRRRAGPIAAVAIHSFTPVYHGEPRPWDVGVIVGDGTGLAKRIAAGLTALGGLCVGVDKPYGAEGGALFHTLHRHGVANDLPAATIEIRQDHIAEPPGQARWAARLARVLGEVVKAL